MRCLAIASWVTTALGVSFPAWAAGPTKVTERPLRSQGSPKAMDPARRAAFKAACLRAYLMNDFAKALRLGQRYLLLFPKDTKILSVVVVAACKMGRVAIVKRIWPRIHGARRRPLKAICLRQGIVLKRGKFDVRGHSAQRRGARAMWGAEEVRRMLREEPGDPSLRKMTSRMIAELRSCFPPHLMASAKRYSGVWVVLLDLKVSRRGRVTQVRARPSWRHASIALACLRVATARWRFASRPKATTFHYLLRVHPRP